MPLVKPFQAYRFNSELKKELSLLTAPPYDVISPNESSRLRSLHPNNVVRLILPEGGADRYDAARSLYQEWRDQGVLVADPEEAFYLYEQEFSLKDGSRQVRQSIICRVRLPEREGEEILGHEHTFQDVRDDRLRLVSACRANFSSVLALYPETAPEIEGYLQKTSDTPPEDEVITEAALSASTSPEPIRHRLWRISDKNAQRSMSDFLSAQKLFIADGHHRFATAMNYRERMRQKDPALDPGAPCNFVMMTLAHFDSEGVSILPTHRLIKKLPNVETASIRDRVSDLLDIYEVDAAEFLAQKTARGLAVLEKTASPNGETPAFGLFTGGDTVLVGRLKESIAEGLKSQDPVEQLDVSFLHNQLLGSAFGLDEETSQKNVHYTRDEEEAVDLVRKGEYQMVVFLNSPRPEQVRAVASSGDRMPAKSTYFYPKVLTGLAIHSLE